MGQLLTDLNFISRARNIERLFIRIDCNKIDSVRPGAHHAVDNIVAAAANADHFNANNVFNTSFQSECHDGSSYYLLCGMRPMRKIDHNIKCTLYRIHYIALFPCGQ